MPLALDRVTVFARHRDPITGEVSQRLVEHNPYVRLVAGGEPPIFLQQGAAYYENGTPVETLPDWAEAAINQMSHAALVSVGWAEPAEAVPSGASLSEQIAALSPLERQAILDQLRNGAPSLGVTDVPPTPAHLIDADDFTPDDDDILDDVAPPVPTDKLPEPVDVLPPVPGASAKVWQCDDCGEIMELKRKGFHRAHHVQAQKRALAAQEE